MAKKKKSTSLLALLLVLVLLIVAYVAYDLYEKKQEKLEAGEEEDTTIELLKMEADEIVSISYEKPEEQLTLVKNSENAWREEENPQIPLDGTYTDNMATALLNLTAKKVIVEEASDLEEYGLANPALTVSVTKTDGSTVVIHAGEESPLGDGYYVSMGDEKKVYLVDAEFVNAYSHTENELIEAESAPSITATNITNLLIEDKENGTFELAYEDNNSYDTSDNNVTPYTILQGYDAPVSGDSTTISPYLENFSGLSYVDCIEYNCSDFSKYGLDEPTAEISINYYEETEVPKETKESQESTEASDGTEETQEQPETETVRTDHYYKFLIGDLDEENQKYYVKDTESNCVYTMSQSKVDSMRAVDVFGLTSRYVQLVNVDSIDSLNVSLADGTAYDFEVEHTTKTKEDGSTEAEDLFTLGGKEMEETDARELYQTILSPRFDARIPEGYSDADRTPDITFFFKRSSGSEKADVKAEYREYDESFYTVTVNGNEFFLADKRAVDKAVAKLKEAKTK